MRKVITGSRIANNYWLRSGSISFMTRLSMMGLSYVNFILLARIFSKEDFGIWIVFLSILKVSESIRTAFIYNPLLKFLNSADKSHREIIISSSLLLNIAISLFISGVISLIGIMIGFFSDMAPLDQMLYISLIAILVFSFFSHFNFLQQAKLKFFGTLISSSIQKFIPTVALFYIYSKEFDATLTQITWIYIMGYLVSVFVSFGFLDSKRNAIKFNASKEWITRQFHFGKFTFGTNLSSMLNKSSKEWLLAGFLNSASVALFAPALRILNLFEIPLNAMAQVYYPKIISKVKQEGEIAAKVMYEKSVGIMVLVLIPIVLTVFLFADKVILFLVGPNYSDSIGILRIILIGGVLGPFVRQFGVTMNAIGKERLNFIFMISTSLGGILISVICIFISGLKGAAYATVIIYILSTISCLIILDKQLKVSFFSILTLGFKELYVQLKSIHGRR